MALRRLASGFITSFAWPEVERVGAGRGAATTRFYQVPVLDQPGLCYNARPWAGGSATMPGLQSRRAWPHQVATKTRWQYPEARKGEVVDDYHGTGVADPYRWLEDPEDAETQRWVEAQNRLTRSYIDSFPHRGDLETRLTALWNYPKHGLPLKHGGRYFYSRNDGLQIRRCCTAQVLWRMSPGFCWIPTGSARTARPPSPTRRSATTEIPCVRHLHPRQ